MTSDAVSTAACSQPVPESEPIVQKVMERSWSSAKEMISDMMDDANIEKITPMRMMLFVDSDLSSA